MSNSEPKQDPVHYPEDRRFRIWLAKPALAILVGLFIFPILAAWLYYIILGLPAVSTDSLTGPLTFPLWLRLAHFFNFLLLLLLIRSGLSILMDHPRLYWNDHCTPGSEWLRLTPIRVPKDRVWTAKDDARYISPWFALPGYRHTIGVARHWHLLAVSLWVLNGLVYVLLLFLNGQWVRVIPHDVQVISGAWAVFVHYATFQINPEALGTYNPLQQLAYFSIIFIFPLLSFLTGMAMAPGFTNRFPGYLKFFGGRQSARSIHFLLFFGYILFLLGHLTMVAANGLAGNLNQIALGIRDTGGLGVAVALAGIILVGLIIGLVHWTAWNHPRLPQQLVGFLHMNLMRKIFFRSKIAGPVKNTYTRDDVSPYLWPNGKVPTSDEWKNLAANDFKDYSLRIYGLVGNPQEFSLDELKRLGKADQVTLHNCIQGWSGIAQWGGISLGVLARIVQPQPEAKAVVFHSFGEGLYGGEYYDTQHIDDIFHPQCILAYEMNDQPLTELYGAPLRLRAETQLGYKMVKWVKSIEFVEDLKMIGKGHGGKNEDDEYFDLTPEI